MIYDIHTHNFASGNRELFGEAEKHGISRVLLLGDVLRHCEAQSAEQVREINDDTIADVKKHSDMADGFCYINPALPADFIREEVTRCFAAGLKGVKLEISLCCSNPKLDDLMAVLKEYDRPLLHHCWFKTVGKYGEESDPSDIRDRFRELDKLLGHLPLEDNNAVFNLCCSLCTAYEHKAFLDGLQYGAHLIMELNTDKRGAVS